MTDWNNLAMGQKYIKWPHLMTGRFYNLIRRDFTNDENLPEDAWAWDSTNNYWTKDGVVHEGIISRDTTPIKIVNDASEDDLHSHTVPANIMGTNRCVRLTAIGRQWIQSGFADDMIFRIKFGSTTVATFDPRVEVNQAGWFRIRNEIMCDGSSASQVSFSEMLINPCKSYSSLSDGDSFQADDGDLRLSAHFTLAEGTTTDKTYKVTIDMDYAGTTRWVEMMASWVEIL